MGDWQFVDGRQKLPVGAAGCRLFIPRKGWEVVIQGNTRWRLTTLPRIQAMFVFYFHSPANSLWLPSDFQVSDWISDTQLQGLIGDTRTRIPCVYYSWIQQQIGACSPTTAFGIRK